ncbi:MAG: bifunctional diaminohydroxyphosphoribosylaminopyrimidine deaminase/5-amino-6-(5-phosphoribosylamino)uracil reductase RibD [Alkalicoccus sp.]|nr:MAG: bifunctional diaminohydroxyphosphoribosylaminopyrimidine deaminase/5-amino-6-(5-phosphoribosylamino)uracil reductase RibD [Alkalicoccus sp.]
MKENYMKLAIEMAASAKGQTSPNPLVGAVIVKQGEVIGLGAHLKAGEKHAEKHALDMAGSRAEGADMYVTLEPCSHTGRTPPCADAVIDAGIKRVFIGSDDPDPRVSGRGINKLRKAGVEVHTGFLKEEADALNFVFFHFAVTKTPYVTLKMAASIDGKIAASSGESKWITGSASRMDGHFLRHENDAILAGIETILADNPLLTTRLPQGGKNPLRIILDSRLRIPSDAKALNEEAPSWIFTTEQAEESRIKELREAGVTVTVMSGFTIQLDEVMEKLGQADVSSLLVEGGGTVHDSFLREKLFQQVVLYMAPLLIGGKDAPSSVSGSGIHRLADVPRLKLLSVERLGEDTKHIFHRESRND